jgi:hypothetical protein
VLINNYKVPKKLYLHMANETLTFNIECDVEMDNGVKDVWGIWLKTENDSSFLEEDCFLYYRIKNMIIKTISEDL